MLSSRNAYTQLLAGLRDIGYRGALLEEKYGFCDWFTPGCEKREVLAAAFGQTPVAYDSALIGVVEANGLREQALVNQCRSLGAPVILEIDRAEIREWAVSRNENAHGLINRHPLNQIRELLTSRASAWKPDTFLRAKSIGDFHWLRQLELFSGLVPELEEQIQAKLDPLLRETMSATKQAYSKDTGRDPDESKLFKLVFWLLTAKVFRDRRVRGFASLGRDADQALSTVAAHYGSEVPPLLTRDARQVAANHIWASLDFRNLSVEVLSHIWSTTLIDPSIRLRLGIHRTSRTIVRYIIDQIPLEGSGDEELIILEPCAGSAVFLVGVMNALRQKWFGMPPTARHEYFTTHLAAVERDPFGVEISTLALTLADFPNPNGWNVRRGDVFQPGVLMRELRRAGVVFCNPPFEAFDEDERVQYDISSTKKPVELLTRVLDDLHPRGVLGFVLPRLFIDGHGYAEIRKRLAERFASLQITALPDRAFKADVEVALLIATDPIPHKLCHVVTRKVNDSAEDWRKFELRHELSQQHSVHMSSNEIERGLPIPDLPEVWEFLSRYPQLNEHADLRRGLEWNEPLTVDGVETGNRAKFIRDSPVSGFMRGLAPRATFDIYRIPKLAYLSMKPSDQRVNAWQHDWSKPKAILNKSARSRGPWRLAAFPDSEGVTCYQTFIGVWPTSESFDEWLLTAILNSPVANAFVAAREGKTDVTVETLRLIPVPRFTEAQAREARELIVRYQAATEPELYGGSSDQVSEEILKRLDAVVLSAYRLTPRLERKLLDFFGDSPRPTSHRFTRYFPVDCEVYFSLSDFLSPRFADARIENLLKRTESP
jgi:hypothetical protein